MHIILYQPEIPPNTGNIIRLCANTGACLHLIEPLGFSIEDAKLRRAGLDYHEFAELHVHADLQTCLDAIGIGANPSQHPAHPCADFQTQPRVFAMSTRGTVRYDTPRFADGDAFLFGPETRGLPAEILAQVPEAQRLYLPMRPDNRSLNLSNAVAVMVFEAWRQRDFAGAKSSAIAIDDG